MMTNMSKDLETLQAERPSIITTEIEAIGFYRKMDTNATVEAMIAGKYVLVEEFYSNGLQVLNELRRNLLLKYQDKTEQGKKDYRKAFRTASHRLLLKIKDNTLVVKKAPDFGWLKILYPDVSEFYVAFPDVQGMNSAWQFYEKGIEVKTLNLTIHPFYGTYFPTRFDHLKLVDKWLNKYEGEKNNAIEIGVGSGVLSYQLIQNGFENIFATDSNKNAIIGLSKEIERLKYKENITLNHGKLFENCEVKADVIMLNPDKSMVEDEAFFAEFFEKAVNHLSDNGKIVIVFSSTVEAEEKKHPVIEELQKNNRYKKALHLKRDIRASSRRTKRREAKDTEKVELWVLGLKK
jgi:16S rRNA G966 N2-methylase RsmD